MTCFLGSCFDCFDPGYECAEDELCIANMGGVGECQDNPCFGVECEETEFCRDGECIATVCDPTCLEGQFCDEGTCVDDPCAEVNCPDPFICNPETGDCVNDPCEDVSCPPGRACNPSTGECENDPCIGVDCPDGFRCEVDFGGGAVCRPEPTNPGDPGEDIFAAGGGCACDVSQRGAPGTGSWILILLVALGIGRYRRTCGPGRPKGSAQR
jgi:MYXO-CTERM domain-containing protein